jgi:hypothetical protein
VATQILEGSAPAPVQTVSAAGPQLKGPRSRNRGPRPGQQAKINQARQQVRQATTRVSLRNQRQQNQQSSQSGSSRKKRRRGGRNKSASTRARERIENQKREFNQITITGSNYTALVGYRPPPQEIARRLPERSKVQQPPGSNWQAVRTANCSLAVAEPSTFQVTCARFPGVAGDTQPERCSSTP